ncbi:MAG: enoyl-ACP reductase, partial [Acetobacteraceae bacterium]|nr:enoyl-ACP reductase [Acetobacteraceae bacterium]
MPEAPLADAPTGTLMAGKRGLVMGVANDRSIAWGIARAVAAQGGKVALTYQSEALEKRVRPLAESIGSRLVLPCDVTDDASVDAAFRALEGDWGRLDFLVHAIGFADKQYLRGRYLDTPRDAFVQALDISCYSFVSVCQRAVPLMRPGGSLLTMSYLGAERVTPHYNVMGVAKAALEASVRYMATDLGERGIRVNAISAG